MKGETTRNAAIAGTGSYLPERILTNADLERMVDTTDEWIRTRTGISERRIAGADEAADPGLEVDARPTEREQHEHTTEWAERVRRHLKGGPKRLL